MSEVGAKEAPAGPSPLAQQAFEIHISNVKQLPIGPSLEKDEENKRLNADQKTDIDHARRFLKGQPHDPVSAGKGLRLALDEAKKVERDARRDPDAAAAAEKDIVILEQLFLRNFPFSRPMRLKIEGYKSRYPAYKPTRT